MDAKTASLWGAIIVSIVTLLTFTGALVVSFFVKDGTALLNLTVGAAIANATTAVGFWLGSSSGSQKKDDVIGAQLAGRNGAGAAAPVVTGINPTSGAAAGGTMVTVTGSGFTGATAVRFGTNSASGVMVVSDTQITATSPAGIGTVDVTVVTPAGTSATSPADRFTYN